MSIASLLANSRCAFTPLALLNAADTAYPAPSPTIPAIAWFIVPADSLNPVSMPASLEREKSTMVLGITIEEKSTKTAPIAGLVFRKFST